MPYGNIDLWQHRSMSTLAQVMACCLTAPSHSLIQCWLIISKVQWHSSKGNFTAGISAINHCNWLKKYSSKISLNSPRPQWVNSLEPGRCGSSFKSFIYKHTLWIKFMLSTSCEIAHRWMPQGLMDDFPTLVQIMAWCYCLSGNKPLPEPMLNEFYVAIRHHKTRISSSPFRNYEFTWPLACKQLNILCELCQYHACWCPG